MPDPSDVIPTITNAWRDAGMPDRGIAGVLFNIKEESGFDPTQRVFDQRAWTARHGLGEPSYAHGLYQEGADEWQRYQSFLAGRQGADWRDPELQSQFAAWNLKNNYPSTWAKMVNAKSPEQAAAVYANEYLKPSAPNLASRMNKIFGGVPKMSAYDAAPPEDLLGKWLAAPTGNQPAAPQPGIAASEPASPPEDLLSSWKVPESPAAPSMQTAAPAAPQGAPSAVSSPAISQPSGPETAPQALTRLMAEHQGDTWTDRSIAAAAGVGRGLGNVGDTIAQGITALGDNAAKALARYGAISPESAKAVEDWRTSVNQGIDQDQAAFQTAAKGSLSAAFGQVGGEIAGTGPFLGIGAAALRGTPLAATLAARPIVGSIVKGAATGAGTTALTSAASDMPLGEQLAAGGGAGAVLGPLGHAATRALGAGVNPEVGRLAGLAIDKYGIPLRADQLSTNPMVRFLGSVLQRLPLTGLNPAEQQATFSRAIAHEMGEVSDNVTMPVLQAVKTRTGQMFDDVANRTGPIRIDHAFAADVGNVLSDARTVLGDEAKPIENLIQKIGSRIDPATGTISPKAYQATIAHGSALDRAMESNNSNVGFYSGKLRDALDDMMQRTAPADAVADLKTARYQYAIMKAVEPLAKESPTGDISPAKLLSKATGGNLMELGQIGKQFLREPPSSGTAERSLLLGALSAGLGTDYAFDPEGFQRHALMAAAGLGAARAGGALIKLPALTRFLARRGQQQQGSLLSNIIPAAGALATRNIGTAFSAPQGP